VICKINVVSSLSVTCRSLLRCLWLKRESLVLLRHCFAVCNVILKRSGYSITRTSCEPPKRGRPYLDKWDGRIGWCDRHTVVLPAVLDKKESLSYRLFRWDKYYVCYRDQVWQILCELRAALLPQFLCQAYMPQRPDFFYGDFHSM
jgi:hypothetical protein